jgi:hypothetical protein
MENKIMKNTLLVLLLSSMSLSLIAGQPADTENKVGEIQKLEAGAQVAVVEVQAQLPENLDDAVVGCDPEKDPQQSVHEKTAAWLASDSIHQWLVSNSMERAFDDGKKAVKDLFGF